MSTEDTARHARQPVACRYIDGHGGQALGHGEISGDRMSVGVFTGDGQDVGNVAAHQATVLRDKPVQTGTSPDLTQGDTIIHGWG